MKVDKGVDSKSLPLSDWLANQMEIKSISFWNPLKVKILYLHAPDHETPLLETLTAINDLYKEGKFEEFGLSNFSSWVSFFKPKPPRG